MYRLMDGWIDRCCSFSYSKHKKVEIDKYEEYIDIWMNR
jgi:hypothetical protein